jgi:glycosyltransferase involved in cell wall biosynthesis
MSGSANRRVLIVSRETPPAISPHPIRVAKLAKYLPELGWDVTVLTVPIDHVVARDDELAAEFAGTPVVRVPRLLSRVMPPVSKDRRSELSGSDREPRPIGQSLRSRLAKTILLPDRDVMWAIPATRAASRLADQFDAVLTTAPPFSTHLVGESLARRHGLPWVAEYRDNWTPNALYRRHALGQWFNSRLERRFLEAASAVVVVSEAAASELCSSFPGVQSKVHIGRNGYDPDDLPPRAPRATEFEIVYTGSMEGRRDPRPFFEALGQLVATRPEVEKTVRLHLIGWVVDWALQAARTAIGPDRVVFDGLLTHREALLRASRAAVLLGITTRMEAGGAGLTSKLFEYMGLGRPILMLAPDGPASQLVTESGCGLAVEPDDVDAIAWALGDLFDEWRAGTERFAKPELLAGLTRRATAQAVAAALEAATATPASRPEHHPEK